MLNNRLPKVKGTKKLLSSNQLLISSGLPTLDNIIGNGIPVGSIFLLKEDEFGTYSNIIMKHFLAEGIITGHALYVVGEIFNDGKFVRDLPAPITDDQPKPDNLPDIGELKIAWRYRDLPSADSTETSLNLFGHSFDMSRHLSSSLISSANITFYGSKPNLEYEDVFENVLKLIKEPRFSFNAPVENRTVLRIIIHLIGAPYWEGEVVLFLMKLRVALRNTCCACFITLSPYMIEEKHLLHRIEHLCDTVVRVQSLLNDGNPAYSDYNGLLFLDKLPIINDWNSYIPENNDWAFKFKKKHFRIEKLHISPDIKETAHREDEDISKEYETQKIISNVANQF